jgi:hypothetical protein
VLSRRILIIPLALIMAVQFLIPAPSFAALAKPSAAGSEEPKVSLEQAIQTIKKNFEIPSELREFSSGFDNYNSRQAWSLSWSSEDGRGSLTSQVDAVSGEILSVYWSKPSVPDQYYKLPELSLELAEKAADEALKKLSGNKYQALKKISDRAIIPIDIWGQTRYNFSWQRTENGVPVQGDGANVQIDAATGQLLSYSLNWNNMVFPKTGDVIDAEKASHALSKAKLFEMRYFLAPEVKPLIASGGSEQVQLVYQLKNNGTIAALPGKPLLLNQVQWLANEAKSAGGMGSAEADAAAVRLTPQEQQEITDNAKLLSKEQAMEAVKRWIAVPSSLSLRNANLYKDSGIRNLRVWSFHWESREQSIDARVNAEDGELLSFSSYQAAASSSPDSAAKALSKEEAQKIAEDFLTKIQADKLKQAKLNTDALSREIPASDVLASKMPVSFPAENTSITFSYERIVNGILFPSNQISATVDLFSKKITSYNLNWWNLDFPQLSEAISQSKAEELFFRSRPIELQYVIVYDQGEAKEARLVYRPSSAGAITSDLMDAKNGLFLDWQGNPLKDHPRRLSFNDISGDPAEKEIATLGLAGIFGEYQDQFKPQESITVPSLLKALITIKNGSADPSLISAADLIKEAEKLGWVREELSSSQTVSKELFSKIIIRYIGLEKIALINDIYTSSYTDCAKLYAGCARVISLPTGLNILPQPSDGKFDPARPMTLSEAARSIIQALGCGFRY